VPFAHNKLSLTSAASFGRAVSGSTRTGFSGMLCRGARNGNTLEASSLVLLEVFSSRDSSPLREAPGGFSGIAVRQLLFAELGLSKFALRLQLCEEDNSPLPPV
jgi:hypothetical protein